MDHLEKLRSVVRDCLSKHLHSSAVFFADKLLTMSEHNPADVYLLAQAYYLSAQYRRALHLLRQEHLLAASLRFKYLAAKCLGQMKEWDECLAVLGEEDTDLDAMNDQEENMEGASEGREINIVAALCLLRGRAYDALENRMKAMQWYQAALRADSFCYEAFEHLFDNQMLTSDQEKRLLAELEFSPDERWLQLLYSCRASKHGQEDSLETKLSILEGLREDGDEPCWSEGQIGLEDNLDVQVCRAEVQYHRGEFELSYGTSKRVLERDPFHLPVMPCHLAAAVELKRKNELFLQAHRLVDEYPQKALAWFAVGCYYLCIKQYEQARRYFCKATALERTFAPAWLGFGNAYAAQDESDQAMAAYRTAARLFPGCHLAVLGIGIEYQKTNNLQLAQQFLQDALKMCPHDPLVHHELGVVAFRNLDHEAAIHHFESALQRVPEGMESLWEATVLNLGHGLRKLRRYPEAIQRFEQALALCPRQPAAFAALGFTYHLQGNVTLAIDYYHKALGLRPDDSFSAEMLTLALSEECSRHVEAGEAQLAPLGTFRGEAF